MSDCSERWLDIKRGLGKREEQGERDGEIVRYHSLVA